MTRKDKVAKLATEFKSLLKARLTKEQWADLLARNTAEQDANVCHSHDFCDANMVMANAWWRVLEPESYDEDPNNDDRPDVPDTKGNRAIEDEAWKLAMLRQIPGGEGRRPCWPKWSTTLE